MSDYLWDRSGEPHKEIQRLEEILGPLSYQPRPLEIPANVVPARRRKFLPALAIAAAIALAAIALGLWFNFNRGRAVMPRQAGLTPRPVENANLKSLQSVPAVKDPPSLSGKNSKTNLDRLRYRAANRYLPAQSQPRSNNPTVPQPKPETIATRRAEAEAAKEQLMVALRLVSSKLNLAQKRAQGGYPGNLIRNQHKVG